MSNVLNEGLTHHETFFSCKNTGLQKMIHYRVYISWTLVHPQFGLQQQKYNQSSQGHSATDLLVQYLQPSLEDILLLRFLRMLSLSS